MIAHILKNAEKEPVQLLCNYDWWEIVYYGKYFTQEDKEVYLDCGYQQGTKAYRVEAKDQSGADDWRYAGLLEANGKR